MKQSSRLSIDG